MKKLIYALRFMTVLPIPWRENEDLVQVSRSSGMFPLVGLIIGLLLGLSHLLFYRVLSAAPLAFIQTVLWIGLTGGLHLDGLADTFDGIGSGRERDRMLEIMKDSSIGAFGALALVLQILFKFIFIRELNELSPWLIIIPPLSGRWGQLIAIYCFPSARPDGMGHFFRDHIRINEVILGIICTILIYLLLMPVSSLLILLAHSSFILGISAAISKKLKGLTGDVYGLVCETGESVTLLFLLLYLKGVPGFSTAKVLNQLIHLFF